MAETEILVFFKPNLEELLDMPAHSRFSGAAGGPAEREYLRLDGLEMQYPEWIEFSGDYSSNPILGSYNVLLKYDSGHLLLLSYEADLKAGEGKPIQRIEAALFKEQEQIGFISVKNFNSSTNSAAGGSLDQVKSYLVLPAFLFQMDCYESISYPQGYKESVKSSLYPVSLPAFYILSRLVNDVPETKDEKHVLPSMEMNRQIRVSFGDRYL
jgi:hypothetical protein